MALFSKHLGFRIPNGDSNLHKFTPEPTKARVFAQFLTGGFLINTRPPKEPSIVSYSTLKINVCFQEKV